MVGPPDIGMRTVFIPGFRSPVGTDRVDAKSLQDLSSTAGGRSFIVPTSGEKDGESFETALFAIADNIAKGYTIGALVPVEVAPSTVEVTVVKRLGLDVRARPTASPR